MSKDIFAVCCIAVVTAILALTIRKHNKEIALLLSIGGGILILLSVIDCIVSSVSEISDILAQSMIKSEYILILLKVLGICFLTEFTCDCTKEAGMDVLTGNISLAGKIIVLMTSLPLFTEVLNTVVSLVTGT